MKFVLLTSFYTIFSFCSHSGTSLLPCSLHDSISPYTDPILPAFCFQSAPILMHWPRSASFGQHFVLVLPSFYPCNASLLISFCQHFAPYRLESPHILPPYSPYTSLIPPYLHHFVPVYPASILPLFCPHAALILPTWHHYLAQSCPIMSQSATYLPNYTTILPPPHFAAILPTHCFHSAP